MATLLFVTLPLSDSLFPRVIISTWSLHFLYIVVRTFIHKYRRMQHDQCESERFQSIFGRHFLEAKDPLTLNGYYFATGAYADMSRGNIGEDIVTVKVWRGVPWSVKDRTNLEMQLSKQLDEWKRCAHINIVPFLGVQPRQNNLPLLITPHYENGTVMRYISKNPSADRFYLINGIAAAVGYLHSLSPPIFHGDIRGSNVFVDDTGNACLTDISMAKVSFPSDWSQANGTGSARWMAPELIDPKEDDDAYPSQTDVYSFGMTILEIITGRPPFMNRRQESSVIFDVYHGRRPPRPANSELTDSIWALIQSCWHQDPKQRINISAAGFWLALLSQTQTARANMAAV
ncbi:hypothetical protein PILCRDRAFT_827432 [Piloderma croceum F 1598]|uniref:Protein kinase domain-containing protein n=1 Tax=Piloderma croceum (strain F 1598) TaxID=765440 RepID=A0A0C3BDH0_PILCF|nr:hypothetical protein PILCRDRAFT_827432 [Piloderma croceum F 1598]